MSVAGDLRGFLRAKKIKQLELAKALGCSDAYVSDMLLGHRRITPLFLNKICSALSVSPEYRKQCHVRAARESGWDV